MSSDNGGTSGLTLVLGGTGKTVWNAAAVGADS